MSLDTTEIGVVAAKVMEDVENAAWEGEARVLAAAVIYEVRDEQGSTVGLRVTDDRNVLGLGLLARAHEALTGGEHGDLSDD